MVLRATLLVIVAYNVQSFSFPRPEGCRHKSTTSLALLGLGRIFRGRIREDLTDEELLEENTEILSNSHSIDIAGIADSIESLKRTRRAGQSTQKLIQECSAITVEGSSSDGKVRVTVDCQQRPVKVTIEDSIIDPSDSEELCSALVTAMQDAHTKSLDRMNGKLKSFYMKLGMAPIN